MKLLKGTDLRDKKREYLKSKIEDISIKTGDKFIPPTLVIFQIGDNTASSVYIEQKKKFATYIGAQVLHIKMSDEITEEELIQEIQNYNKDDTVHGIIVQLPLPRHITPYNVTNSIDYKKDVDGLSSTNLGLLVKRNFKLPHSGFQGCIPATAKGVLSLLEEYNINVEGKKVCIVGRSVLVGKPISLLMLALDATITVCHSKTNHLEYITRESEILIVATGSPKMINKNFVSKDQIIIDVGITSVDGKLCGDVDVEDVDSIINAVTPVPGGVGPLTVCSLFENLFESFINSLI